MYGKKINKPDIVTNLILIFLGLLDHFSVKNILLLSILLKVLWFYHNNILVMHGNMDIEDF